VLWEHLHQSPHRRLLQGGDCCIERDVPSCGDSIRLECKFDGERLADIGFEADGCVISQAQASLVCQLVAGRQTAEIRELIEEYEIWLNGGPWPQRLAEDDLRATQGTRRFPLRHQCLSLAWKALAQALAIRPTETGAAE
jgi:nitrogen fixation NifU-like protein